jgi:hypothetical protein
MRLTGDDLASLIVDGGWMESRSVFISSCSRRQLARRSPHRSSLRLQLLMVLALVCAALVAFIVARGGI